MSTADTLPSQPTLLDYFTAKVTSSPLIRLLWM